MVLCHRPKRYATLIRISTLNAVPYFYLRYAWHCIMSPTVFCLNSDVTISIYMVLAFFRRKFGNVFDSTMAVTPAS